MFGIYKIINKVNNKCYVGQVGKGIGKTFETRWNEHLRDLRRNKHINRNGKPDKLQNAWNKYGEDNFTFDILEVIENLELLDEREVYWIEYYDSFKNGYNQTKGGEGLSGYKHTEETKQKISKSNKISQKGNKNSLGYKHTIETKEKNREAHFGKIHSEETKKKISKNNAMKNKSEVRKKVSEALKDNKNTLGYKHTEESRKKISESIKEYWKLKNKK